MSWRAQWGPEVQGRASGMTGDSMVPKEFWEVLVEDSEEFQGAHGVSVGPSGSWWGAVFGRALEGSIRSLGPRGLNGIPEFQRGSS